MNTKNDILNEILINTNGMLLYSEQIIEIGTKVLGLTLFEANTLRKDLGKGEYITVSNHISSIRAQIEDTILADKIINLLQAGSRNAISKMYVDMHNNIYNNILNEICKIGNGQIIYKYQVHFLLKDIVQLNASEIEDALYGSFSFEILKDVIHKELENFPKIAEKITELLRKNYGLWKETSIALIPFEQLT